MRGTKFEITASEFDKILIVDAEGVYRVVSPSEKLFVGKKAPLIQLFDEEEGVEVTVLYRDDRKMAWAKKIHIKGFIRDKTYPIAKGDKPKVDRVLIGDSDQVVHLHYVPMKRQRLKEDWFDLRGLEVCGLGARGKRMGSKPVQRITLEAPS